MKQKKLIRLNFRQAVFKRDNFKCCFCNETEMLDAHHITDRSDMPNGGYVKENGITVCGSCHLECEQYHISGGSEWVDGKHPEDLYRMISSSKEEAFAVSKQLQ